MSQSHKVPRRIEVRRDLLVPRFTPFAEMIPEPAKVARAAEPFAACSTTTRSS